MSNAPNTLDILEKYMSGELNYEDAIAALMAKDIPRGIAVEALRIATEE